MDPFLWWEELWSPIARPTADLGAEALRKYQAGEIDFSAYQEALRTNANALGGIAAAKNDYENYVAKNSLDVGGILQPVTALTGNLVALLLVGAALYFLVMAKRLEA